MTRLRVLLIIAVVYLVIGGILFTSAARIDVPMFWAYLALFVILTFIVLIRVYPYLPEMVHEQQRSSADEQDKLTGPLFQVLLATHWFIAGLDVGRYHWSNPIAQNFQIVGLLLCGGGLSLLAWAVMANRFYSARVYIQSERGQEVFTGGPYHYVRHPGYIGWILFMIFSSVALGSWLSVLPNLALVTLIVRRTVIEDRMLQNCLKGYTDYAHRVRYRLIPGLW